jgi:F0F1-type ATP synthase assembly protein I
MEGDKKKQANSLLKLSGLGLQLLAAIGSGAWLGLTLDRYLELKFPVFLLTFVFLIFGGMMFHLYRSLNKD